MAELFPVDLPGGIRLTGIDSGVPPGADRASPAAAAAPARAAAPVVLFLHGFPEAAFAWEPVIERLRPTVRCIAPNLRGYADSSAPADVKAYRARPLVADLEALIDRIGAPVDAVVAHDWGGALAWNLAAISPQRLGHLVILNAPHPATFLRELRGSPQQQAASAYMHFLCRPDAAALLAEDDFRRLWPFFTNMGAADGTRPGGGWLTESLRQRYREVWRSGLEGPLNYYRASPLKPPISPQDALHRLEFPDEAVTIRVPTTVLWGEADTALPPGLIDGLERWVPDLSLIRVPEASHWIAHEQPQRVAEAVAGVLAAPRGVDPSRTGSISAPCGPKAR